MTAAGVAAGRNMLVVPKGASAVAVTVVALEFGVAPLKPGQPALLMFPFCACWLTPAIRS